MIMEDSEYMRLEQILLKALFLGVFFLFVSCATTRKLGENEILYVGVKNMDIETPEKVKLNSTQSSAASVICKAE